MKRIFSVFLAVLMLFSLLSCSENKGKDSSGGDKEKDLASLSATELYERGVEKNKNLKSAHYTTRVLFNGEEAFTIETKRVRGGYEGYDYSQIGREQIFFVGGNAYLSGDRGKYTAPATGRSFDQYLTEYGFALYGVDPETFFEVKREKNTVSYTVTAKDVFSRYNAVLAKDEFTARSMTGTATFSEEAVITGEVISLTGIGRDGTEATLTLETTLSAMRDESIKVSAPEAPEGYLALSDIRLPEKITLAVENLYSAENLQATLVSSNTVTAGEKKYAYNQDVNVYKLTGQSGADFYLSRQSLKQIPSSSEESLFYQCLLKGGVKTENQYNVITGALLSENTASATEISWQSYLQEILPGLSDFATLTMSEDLGGYSIVFTFSEKASQNVLKRVITALPESGKDASAFAVGEAGGTLSVSKETGLLTSLTYTVNGTGAEGESIVGRYSFLLDQTENITLPPLQNPTPTTPGQGV